MALNGLTAAEAAFSLILGKTADGISLYDYLFENSNQDETSVTTAAVPTVPFPCGGKGLCLLLTHLQRITKLQIIGSKLVNPRSDVEVTDSTSYTFKIAGVGILTISEVRERLWSMLKLSLDGNKPSEYAASLNGRTCDAMIRCYGRDVDVRMNHLLCIVHCTGISRCFAYFMICVGGETLLDERCSSSSESDRQSIAWLLPGGRRKVP